MYNVLFAEQNGARAASQIKAFNDTWRWDQAAALSYQETVERGRRVADALAALRTLLGDSNMLAYLAMMAPRMMELRRVLKPTGSLYLHCDPTASHYLKVLLDAMFDLRNYRNEMVWRRTPTKSLAKRRLPNNHDVIVSYQRTDGATWNVDAMFQPYDASRLDPKTASKYRHRDADGRLYQLTSLISPNRNRANLTY